MYKLTHLIGWHTFERLVYMLALIFMAYILYLTLWPFEPLTIHTQPYVITNPNHRIRTGEPILYVIDATKNIDISPIVARKLVGQGSFYTFGDITTSVPVGRNQAVSTTTFVPDKIECGTYYLDLTITYTVNYFHAPIVVHATTEEFEVYGDCTVRDT